MITLPLKFKIFQAKVKYTMSDKKMEIKLTLTCAKIASEILFNLLELLLLFSDGQGRSLSLFPKFTIGIEFSQWYFN